MADTQDKHRNTEPNMDKSAVRENGEGDSTKSQVNREKNDVLPSSPPKSEATQLSTVGAASQQNNTQANVPTNGSSFVNGGGDDVRVSPKLSADSATQHVSPPRKAGEDDELDEEDNDDVDDDWVSEGGDESDVEDNVELAFPLRRRELNPILPETVTALDGPHGGKVYVVGTAHFSTESQDDVSKVIQAVQPDIVMVELCKSRINILELDEAMLLEEAKNINLEKFRMAIRQSGVIQGVMHLLLLSMSAHLTKQLGMAPGGEFRRAFLEARHVPGCRLQLGDRPIQITLKRALGALSVWQKMKLAWYLITTNDPISKEDVEKCKQRDLLEQLLKEMTGEFPALSRVFVEERDIFLTHSLKMAARPRECPDVPEGFVPTVVVGVVGIGHMPGIIANWDKEQDIIEILKIPQGSAFGTVVKWGVRAGLLCAVSYGCYRFFRWTSNVLL